MSVFLSSGCVLGGGADDSWPGYEAALVVRTGGRVLMGLVSGTQGCCYHWVMPRRVHTQYCCDCMMQAYINEGIRDMQFRASVPSF